MRAHAIFCLTVVLLLVPWVGLQPVWANPESAASRFRSKDTKVTQPKPVPRKVLGLFHSSEEESPDKTRIQSFLAMPLNYLGYDVVFFDLARGVPKPSDLDGVAAAVTWFEDDIPGHAAYLTWAAQAARNGLKFVIMEAVGAADGPNEVALIAPLLAEIGLDPVSHFVADTSTTVVREFNPDVVARERPLASPLPLHRYIRRFDSRTASLSRSQGQQPRRLRRERPNLT
ncbi:MAG: hypothetical protein K2Y05_08710, partial [Hyphomicrobiaceae bacterium]|nr:hypothetical protein [Hyphomicrobiaceae bacterium]